MPKTKKHSRSVPAKRQRQPRAARQRRADTTKVTVRGARHDESAAKLWERHSLLNLLPDDGRWNWPTDIIAAFIADAERLWRTQRDFTALSNLVALERIPPDVTQALHTWLASNLERERPYSFNAFVLGLCATGRQSTGAAWRADDNRRRLVYAAVVAAMMAGHTEARFRWASALLNELGHEYEHARVAAKSYKRIKQTYSEIRKTAPALSMDWHRWARILSWTIPPPGQREGGAPLSDDILEYSFDEATESFIRTKNIDLVRRWIRLFFFKADFQFPSPMPIELLLEPGGRYRLQWLDRIARKLKGAPFVIPPSLLKPVEKVADFLYQAPD